MKPKKVTPRKERHPVPYKLPEGFKPTTLLADAARLGINVFKLRIAMKRDGVPVGCGGGRKAFVLPQGFEPTTARADAARLGISVNTLRSAMKREGVPTVRVPPRRKFYVLPEGFVPSTVLADAKRLGVAPRTLSAAMRRQGIQRFKGYRRRSVPPDWARAAEGGSNPRGDSGYTAGGSHAPTETAFKLSGCIGS